MDGHKESKLTNPQILWSLPCCQVREELGLLLPHFLGPFLVVFENAIVCLLQVLADFLSVGWFAHLERKAIRKARGLREC